MIAIQKEFLKEISNSLKQDKRILGLVIGGSYITQDMDKYSDLDLVVAIDPDYYDEVMNTRIDIAGNMGNLLSAFTGEHVGEPRLVIALYDINDSLIHVDYKFVSANELSDRVEDPVILWERNLCISNEFSKAKAHFPSLTYQNIEDKFWIWVHYATVKIGRGELFETIEFLSFLRQNVIGPMILVKHNLLPKGVRKIESFNFEEVDRLKTSIAHYDSVSCINSLEILIELYIELRESLFDDSINRKIEAQRRTLKYLQQVKLG